MIGLRSRSKWSLSTALARIWPEKSQRFVDRARAERSPWVSVAIDDPYVVVLGQLEADAFLPQTVAPADDAVVGDLGEPVVLELREYVAAEYVSVGLGCALVEVGAMPLKPDGCELVESRVVFVWIGLGGRRPPGAATDLLKRLVELEFRERTVPALELVP